MATSADATEASSRARGPPRPSGSRHRRLAPAVRPPQQSSRPGPIQGSNRGQKRPLIRVWHQLVVDKDAVAFLTSLFLQRKRNEIPKPPVRQCVLTRKQAVVRLEADRRAVVPWIRSGRTMRADAPGRPESPLQRKATRVRHAPNVTARELPEPSFHDRSPGTRARPRSNAVCRSRSRGSSTSRQAASDTRPRRTADRHRRGRTDAIG